MNIKRHDVSEFEIWVNLFYTKYSNTIDKKSLFKSYGFVKKIRVAVSSYLLILLYI